MFVMMSGEDGAALVVSKGARRKHEFPGPKRSVKRLCFVMVMRIG